MSRLRVILWLVIVPAYTVAASFAQDEPISSPPLSPAKSANTMRAGSDRSAGGSAGITIESMRLGFEGRYKVGHWTPLAVTLHSDRDDDLIGELVLELVDGDGVSTIVREPKVALAARKSTTVHTLVKPGRPKAPITVRFESTAGSAERTSSDDEIPRALLATQELFVEVGRPIGLSRLRQFYAETSLERPAAANVMHRRELPNEWLGYDGVDVVVVTTSDQESLWMGHPAKTDALEQWVRQGGKLILCVGSGGAILAKQLELPGDTKSPLLRFLPGRIEQVVEQLPGAWESFAGATAEPMLAPDGGRAQPVPMTHLVNVRGSIELSDRDNVPLVVLAPYGFGEVLFVAADLDQPPFSTWPARTKLLTRLLNRTDASGSTSAARETAVQGIRLGYTDLSGQLRAALGQYHGARVAPFWLVFLLALAYAAALFPLEYAIARWIRPHFEAAWVLLPLVLAGSTAGVWYIAGRWKGHETLINKVELVDVDSATGTVRGHAWLGLYSPREDSYDLKLTPVERDAKSTGGPQLSWLGLAGAGLGGMNSQIVGIDQFESGYDFQQNGSLDNVPLAASSSKSFEASWYASIEELESHLGERASDGQPVGQIKNDTQRMFHDSVLFYDGWSYPLGRLAPGASVEVGRNPRLLNIQSYLTDRRPVGDKEQATPYEPEGAELRRIVRAIQFYDAAGGRQYTSLSNRIYDRLDLSGQLRLGRAVLLATGPPATQATVEDHRESSPRFEQDLAFYRFVIPVDRSGINDQERPTVELRLE